LQWITCVLYFQFSQGNLFQFYLKINRRNLSPATCGFVDIVILFTRIKMSGRSYCFFIKIRLEKRIPGPEIIFLLTPETARFRTFDLL